MQALPGPPPTCRGASATRTAMSWHNASATRPAAGKQALPGPLPAGHDLVEPETWSRMRVSMGAPLSEQVTLSMDTNHGGPHETPHL